MSIKPNKAYTKSSDVVGHVPATPGYYILLRCEESLVLRDPVVGWEIHQPKRNAPTHAAPIGLLSGTIQPDDGSAGSVGIELPDGSVACGATMLATRQEWLHEPDGH